MFLRNNRRLSVMKHNINCITNSEHDMKSFPGERDVSRKQQTFVGVGKQVLSVIMYCGTTAIHRVESVTLIQYRELEDLRTILG